jgi:nucleoside-diphosphate-sugar epimerase
MTKILVTGANSFIGSNFRKFSKFKDVQERSVFNYKSGDIDFSSFDVVLHLAAIVHQSGKISEQEYFFVNRDLCLLIAENAKREGIKHFVFLSTIKVYGNSKFNIELLDEDSVCKPDDSYGRSKFEAETGLLKLADANFIVSIVRTPLVYGEGVKANMLSLIKLADKFPLLPLGNISNRRNFTYIENLTGFIDRIMEKRVQGIFILKDEGAISTSELLEYIIKYLDRKVILFPLPGFTFPLANRLFPSVFDRLFGNLEFDNSLTKIRLDYKPPFSTEEGIKRMIEAYKNNEKE